MASILKVDQLQSDTGTVTVASNLAFSGASTFVGNISNPTITGTMNLIGGQIKFPATQIASADGNTLDDYEEGTFTPTLTPAGGSLTLFSDGRQGQYVKIGKLVHINMWIRVQTISTPTGTLTVGGLPFIMTASSDCRPRILCHGYNWNNNTTEWSTMVFIAEGGATSSVLGATTGNWQTNTASLAPYIAGATEIYISGTYTTS